VLLLWLYLSGLVVIVGAEMNAEIEHASEHGKARGEKRPGQRKTIGVRAEREHREKRQEAPETKPAPEPNRRSARPAAYVRTGVLLGGAIAALFGRGVKQ
jgi:membrane protein